MGDLEVDGATTEQLPHLYIAPTQLSLYLSSSPSPDIFNPSELTQWFSPKDYDSLRMDRARQQVLAITEMTAEYQSQRKTKNYPELKVY